MQSLIYTLHEAFGNKPDRSGQIQPAFGQFLPEHLQYPVLFA
jgi:hypothetical protein